MHVTKDLVQRAIIELLNEKQNPTQEKIRQLIGGGSNSTITKYRSEITSEWHASMAVTLPPGLPDGVGELFVDLWSRCTEFAREQLNKEFELAKQAMAEANDAKDEAALEVSKLTERARQTDLALAKSQAALQQSHESKSNLLGQIDYLKDQIITVQKKSSDDLQQQKAMLEEKYRDMISELNSQLAEKKQLVDSLKTQLESLHDARRADIESSAKSLDHWILEVDKVRQDSAAQVESMARIVKRLEAELNISEQKSVQLTQQVDSLRAKVHELTRAANANSQ